MDTLMTHSKRRPGRGKGQVYVPWTQEQEDKLRELVANFVTIPGIALTMNRSESSIKGRLDKLGLKPLARRNRSDFTRGSSDFVSAHLRFTHQFNERISGFCHDRDTNRSAFIEEVVTAFMNQVESSE